MPNYKVSASGTSPETSVARKGRCTAASPKQAIQKLLTRYPQLDEHEQLTIIVTVDDEEEI